MFTGPWREHLLLALVVIVSCVHKVHSGTMPSRTRCSEVMDAEALTSMRSLLRGMMGPARLTTHNTTQDQTESGCFGDIALSVYQTVILQHAYSTGNRYRRSIYDFSILPGFKWPLPIPYKINSTFSDVFKQQIRKAMTQWTSLTCVTFRELGNNETTASYVIFQPGTACISFVGRVEKQPQPVYLSPTCFQDLIVTHEIGHVLGLWHTHQQPGRDAFIQVNNDSIARGERGNFIQLPQGIVISTDTVGYDYGSLMHYDPLDLNRDGRRVLQTLDPLFQNTIGQRVEVSFRDAKAINDAYCQNKCTTSLPTCEHNGYQNPLDCQTCICPDGWSGDQCQNLSPSIGDRCGDQLVANSTRQLLSSPKYNTGSYPSPQECTWRITTNTNRRIKFRFVGAFGIYCTPSANTCHHWIEIRFRGSDTLIGPRFCCQSRPSNTFTAETDEVLVAFRAQTPDGSGIQRRGFQLEYFVDSLRCDSNPCQNGGTCQNTGRIMCICAPGFTGPTCGQTIEPPRCASSPCQAGGTCVESGNRICICPADRTGVFCETEVQGPCASNPCLNDGTCIEMRDRYLCLCPPLYSGFQCEQAPAPCETLRCIYGQCVEQNGVASCNCIPGFTGRRCETDVNECESSPCQNDGFCLNMINAYGCQCLAPYSGDNCELAPAPCETLRCIHGQCVERNGVAFCNCLPGFTGGRCDIEINECDSSPCQNDGFCLNMINAYRCQCLAPYRGENCEIAPGPCETLRCMNGQCVEQNGLASCSCVPGFTGRQCETDINECESSPCQNGGFCLNMMNGYRCQCRAPYSGQNCEIGDPCSSNPCLFGGMCISIPNGYRCLCPNGQIGINCEIDNSPCSSQPCRNGGSCMVRGSTFMCICPQGFSGNTCSSRDPCSSSPCQSNGICIIIGNTYRCICPDGQIGRNCEIDNNPCASQPCLNGGRCMARGTTYICDCPRGFSGVNCNTSTVCNSSFCQNGGSCVARGSAARCICPQGWTGARCEQGTGCNASYCLNGGTCVLRGRTAVCVCPVGRGGTRCQQVTNACHSNPCQLPYTCMPLTRDRYRCICPAGADCDEVVGVDPCSSQPCQNGGLCRNRDSGFTCNCTRGFTGPTCETVVPTNTCIPNPCRNGGTCQTRGTAFICQCPPGLTGKNCEKGNCGGCGAAVGSVTDPCMTYRTISASCCRTERYTTTTSFLIFFTRRVTRTRNIYYSCPKRQPILDTAKCCDNAELITTSGGARKCAVAGWKPFGTCSGDCGGCGRSQRQGYSINRDSRGHSTLQRSTQSRVCNTQVCQQCSRANRAACRCNVPCCRGMRRVGQQCVPMINP